MAYGWGADKPVVDRPVEEGGDSIQSNALKLKKALDVLFIALNHDMARASLSESIAGADITKIITPAAAFRTFYGNGAPNGSLGKNGDVFIQHGDFRNIWIKNGDAWKVIDVVPQPATAEEVKAGQVSARYVTPGTLFSKANESGGFPLLDADVLLPSRFMPANIAVWDKPGSYKWTAPNNVSFVLISGCGGGGGAGSGFFVKRGIASGSAGGAGGHVIDFFVRVTPGRTYTVNVGTGGKGILGSTGHAGGTTSVDSLLSLGGGGGGMSFLYAGHWVGAPGSSPIAAGYVHANGATGGSGLFGTGGMSRTTTGAGNHGSGYGSGGGAGYGGFIGGNGAPGFLSIRWVFA